MIRRACKERRTFSLRYGKRCHVFFLSVYGLRIWDSGYLRFQMEAPCARESARALPLNSAAANTIYGTMLK